MQCVRESETADRLRARPRAWNSQTPGAIRDHEPGGEPLGGEDPDTGSWVSHVPLPEPAEPIPGSWARIRLTAEPWS